MSNNSLAVDHNLYPVVVIWLSLYTCESIILLFFFLQANENIFQYLNHCGDIKLYFSGMTISNETTSNEPT